MKTTNNITTIPTRTIEGLTITYNNKTEQVDFPLSTYETPLFASIKRGVKVSRVHPISVSVLSDCMTRSVIFQCKNVIEVERFLSFLDTHKTSGKMQEIVAKTSHHCKILNVESQVVGNLVYVRFVYEASSQGGCMDKLYSRNRYFACFFYMQYSRCEICKPCTWILQISHQCRYACDASRYCRYSDNNAYRSCKRHRENRQNIWVL